MGIIHQKDKRSGITYAYESVSYWDKEAMKYRKVNLGYVSFASFCSTNLFGQEPGHTPAFCPLAVALQGQAS